MREQLVKTTQTEGRGLFEEYAHILTHTHTQSHAYMNSYAQDVDTHG